MSEQLIELKLGSANSLTISTLGAAIRSLVIDGVALIAPIAPEQFETFHGVVLVPWQNRLENGEWEDRQGKRRGFPINEPDRSNALHGLVYRSEFEVVSRSDERIVLEYQLLPTEGYPYLLKIQIEYQLLLDGMKCSYRVNNQSEEITPCAIGFHPYFCFGNEVENLTLVSGARSRYTQNQNKIPLVKETASGTDWDLSRGVRVGDTSLDDYFTDLDFSSGIAKTSLLTASGEGLEIWQDESLPDLVIYTTDSYPGFDGPIHAIAIEPVAAPANAFATKERLPWISPNQELKGSWGVRKI